MKGGGNGWGREMEVEEGGEEPLHVTINDNCQWQPPAAQQTGLNSDYLVKLGSFDVE